MSTFNSRRSMIAQRQREALGNLSVEEARRLVRMKIFSLTDNKLMDCLTFLLIQKELQDQAAAEDARMSELERRDYDLARRLAAETGSLADSPHIRSRRPATNSKYDLSNYSYAELRDVINTSCGKYFCNKDRTINESILYLRCGIT